MIFLSAILKSILMSCQMFQYTTLVVPKPVPGGFSKQYTFWMLEFLLMS